MAGRGRVESRRATWVLFFENRVWLLVLLDFFPRTEIPIIIYRTIWLRVIFFGTTITFVLRGKYLVWVLNVALKELHSTNNFYQFLYPAVHKNWSYNLISKCL